MSNTNIKKEQFHTFKLILFSYLALSKIFYWITNISEMNLGGFNNIGQLILNRLLARDLFLILCVILSFYIYKIIKNSILAFCIFYVIVLGLSFVQMMVIESIFDLGYGSIFGNMTPLQYFIQFTLTFVFIAIFFTAKEHMSHIKKKTDDHEYAKESPNAAMCFSNALICETCKSDLQDRLHLFGQFVGEWDFEGIYKKGTPEEKHTKGEWIFSWILKGTAIQDVFINPSQEVQRKLSCNNAEYSTTLRFYNISTNTWDLYNGSEGQTCVQSCRQVDDKIFIDSKSSNNNINRAVFFDIKSKTFQWRSESSRDGGATWELQLELMATKKI